MTKTVDALFEAAREALRPILAEASAADLCAVVYRLGGWGCGCREIQAPDAKGWWARNRDDGNGQRVEWFEVVEIQTPAGMVCMVWVDTISDFFPVHDFCSAGTRWCGPFALSWESP